jgi:hypothetical protein
MFIQKVENATVLALTKTVIVLDETIKTLTRQLPSAGA